LASSELNWMFSRSCPPMETTEPGDVVDRPSRAGVAGHHDGPGCIIPPPLRWQKLPGTIRRFGPLAEKSRVLPPPGPLPEVPAANQLENDRLDDVHFSFLPPLC